MKVLSKSPRATLSTAARSLVTLSALAVVDHPTRWHNTLWMLNPCTTTFGPQTIHPDHPQILRYRVVVHDGATPTDLLQNFLWNGAE